METLAKDPALAILPSGRAVSVRNICASRMRDGALYVCHFGETGEISIRDPHDVAAMQAAINHVGVFVEAPTLKGDDADGDGKAG